MSARIRYWQISGTNEYIEQIIKLRIAVQHNIEQELTALSYCKDPRTAGSWT
ncbi:MAG: hypothetical protein HY476_05340, partial [Nitrosarchaeum sp.]|nr:hypothetical protein [Nitrosarchaeum sp.]